MAEKLNEFFTDIIFISTGKQVIPHQETNHEEAIMDIITKYENHISISNIKRKNPESRFSFELTSADEVEALIREIKTNKPMGIDTIPPRILVSLKESISEPVKNIINLMVSEGCFPDQAKICSITAYKKGERTLQTNYRPISILPAVSKLLEKFMSKQMSNYFEKLFSEYLSGFRRGYGCQHVVMRLIESWKSALRGGCSSKNDRFQKYFCDWGSGNFLGPHPFLSRETTSRNTISHSRGHWELGRNLQENIILSKFAL